jgi:hypothetical protein
MRGKIACLLPMLLAGCAPGVFSESSLFQPGKEQPADGLWALLREGCAAPASAAISKWPDCAIAVWLSHGEATAFFEPTPKHLPFYLAKGDPPIIQFQGIEARKDEAQGSGAGAMPNMARSDFEHPFIFWAFAPEGPAPYRKGRTWMVTCPEKEIAGMKKQEGDTTGCIASSAEAVRAAAGITPQADAVLAAVWIAPAD